MNNRGNNYTRNNGKKNNLNNNFQQRNQNKPLHFQQKQNQYQQIVNNNRGQQQKEWPIDVSLDDRYYRQIFTYDIIANANILLVIGLNIHILYYLITVVNNLCECAYGASRNFFMSMVILMIIINLMLLFKVKLNTLIIVLYLVVLLCYVISGFVYIYQIEDSETGCICARTQMLDLTKYILRLMIIVLILSIALVVYNYAIL
jgi:hypothetical protein